MKVLVAGGAGNIGSTICSALEEGPAREGDVVGAYAICDKAKKMLGWDAKLSIQQGIQDAIAWEEKKG